MARARSHTRRRPRANPRGVLSAHAGGFGFVRTAEGEFYVPESKMAGAFDGDLVEVAPLPAQGGRGGRDAHERPAARVLRVVDRAHDSLVGRYEVAEPFGVVVPEDARIPYDVFTMRAERPDIEDGSLVRVRITAFPTRHTAATGVVEEVLGRADDERAFVETVIARHKLETRFSEGALEEARAAVLDEDGALASGYRDLRDRFAFTVDPADARDFDDAVSLEPAEGLPGAPAGAAWRLGVHIADVSHYVGWGGSLDLDARRRATSVYLVDRVIPMLPEELSGDLCSLKPGEARRTMTADLFLDDGARLVGYELYPALIRSKARLSYDEAQKLLDDAADDDGLSRRLAVLSRLAKRRAVLRERAGGLDFATVEARVRLDAEGRPEAIDLRRKTEATSLIEEAMILANETVAAHLRDARFPSLFRVHERPAADGLAALVPVFQEFPWFADVDVDAFVEGDPHMAQRVLAASAGRPEAELVSSLLLRSMKRAVYRPSCEPHYGLASAAYTHFTSPIRRYPDLVVHRMLKAQLFGRPERFDQEASSLPWIAEHSSDMERVAEKAARESQELKIVEYLEGFVGQTFSAVVSGVAAHGLFVRLDNTAEGLVPMRHLGGEFFALDPVLHRLVGQDTGASFRLGQRLAVVLEAADPRAGRLDFRLARNV
ncbi:ribonuclease R [Arabiibacter massiliensis]|uniref:ribonuclease R n=1 Tax=Arabiibacter massiliensis TaxID=1870985 RepID=UPI0009BBBA7F|nr:ribonuclease R [Arabiibacter massiliensis]